jgi:hypothetical protein
LLASDVADVPPDLLERAVREHVTRSPYMPKAAELIALARGYIERARSDSSLRSADMAKPANAKLQAEGSAMRWWYDKQGNIRLGSIEDAEQGRREAREATTTGAAHGEV